MRRGPARRRADVAIIPSIEYQRMDGMVVLPGMAIASKNEVRSLLVICKKPIEHGADASRWTPIRAARWR